MGFWEIAVPTLEDIENLVYNPSIETVTTGYTAVGGSIAASTTKSRRGYRSLAVTPTSSTGDGVYFTTTETLTDGVAYHFGLDIWAAAGVPLAIYFANSTTGALQGTVKEATGNGDWQRVFVNYTASGTATRRLYATKYGGASTDVFYIDGALCVPAVDDFTYFDGDSHDCYWQATPHNSISVAPATSRKYGDWVNLDDYGFYVQDIGSIGMPLVSNQVQTYALRSGAEFMGYKVLPRVFLVQGISIGTSRPDFHSKRKALLDVIKPDYIGGQQEFLLRYYGANSLKPAQVYARYDDGFGMGAIDGYTEKIAIRLLAADPYFYEDGEGGAVLTTELTVTDADGVMKKMAGTWSNISTDFGSSAVNAIVKGKNNEIYIAGEFANVGTANGDYIVSYNPYTPAISALGTGMNNYVYALAVAPNGDLYAGGSFTLAGGVASTVRIAYWNGSAWNPLSTGISSGVVYALAFGQDGTLYVGGSFTNHGDANGDYITSWNGSAWASLGTGMNDEVRALVVDNDNNLYAGGKFTTAGGNVASAVAKWNGSAWSALGDGTATWATNGVLGLAVDARNDLYLTGRFTALSGILAEKIAKWNGSVFSPLGSGLGADAAEEGRGISISDSGVVYVVGTFTTAGPIPVWYGAIWNGSGWNTIDAAAVGTSRTSVLVYANNVFITTGSAGNALASAITEVNNTGSASAYPKISITRSGGTLARLVYLKNETTGATLYIYYQLLNGETITIDVEHMLVESTLFGNITNRAVLRGSDFTNFKLLPGINRVGAFLYAQTSPTITAYLSWPITHWGVDGVST